MAPIHTHPHPIQPTPQFAPLADVNHFKYRLPGQGSSGGGSPQPQLALNAAAAAAGLGGPGSPTGGAGAGDPGAWHLHSAEGTLVRLVRDALWFQPSAVEGVLRPGTRDVGVVVRDLGIATYCGLLVRGLRSGKGRGRGGVAGVAWEAVCQVCPTF